MEPTGLDLVFVTDVGDWPPLDEVLFEDFDLLDGFETPSRGFLAWFFQFSVGLRAPQPFL